MNIVVCVKYVPDAQADRTFNASTTRPTARTSTACCPSSTSTPSRQALKLVEAGEGEVTVAHGRSRRRQPTPSRRPCRWAPTRACTSRTTRSTAPTPPRRPSCWPRRSRSWRRQLDLVLTGMASTDGTMGVVPAMLAERLGLPAGDLRLASSPSRAARRHRSAATATPRPRRSRRRLPAARVRHRPDQRAALPLVQGDHGGEEEAGRDLVARRPRRRRRRRSASTPPGRRSTSFDRAPAAHAGHRSSPTRATAARSSPPFLAARKFI